MPIQQNGRVLVPLRGVFEKMGIDVHWTSSTRQIDATGPNNRVQLWVGNRVASVDGRDVTLDVAPMIIQNSTMVPLRFVGESLGASVAWRPQTQTVEITTAQAAQVNTYRDVRPTRITLGVNSVIPVSLSSELSSDRSREGDKFMADIRTDGQDNYGGIPAGSRIEGHVVMAKAKEGNNPGVLQLAMDRLVFTDGTSQQIDGSLVGLDSKSVDRNDDGTLRAKPGQATAKDPLVYVGYGAGAGAVLALLTKGNLVTDTVIGGALGYLLNVLQKNNTNPKNVTLTAGTQFGVRLNRQIDQR
jgi:hypothetical protein